MKTKYFFGAAAVLMLSACSQDEIVNVQQEGINYTVVAPKAGKAFDSYCNTALPGSFKVWAQTTDNELYINGDVIKNMGGNPVSWVDQDGVRYWPENKVLNFFAEVNGDAEFDFNGGAPKFNNFTVKSDVNAQLDLIYAVAKGKVKADQTVQLNFRHALSQVCFRATNLTKNLRVSIKQVSVGHLAENGTFTFPTESTSENYENHNDYTSDEPSLNGGQWDVNYNTLVQYDVNLGTSVVLEPNTVNSNLTCPEDNHVNGFANVLTLMPQTAAGWDPSVTGADYNGAYFLLDLVFENVVATAEGNVYTEITDAVAALPVDIDWLQGKRYIYTFIFNEGTNGGWTADPNDPKPLLTNISYETTVDDFIPVNADVEWNADESSKPVVPEPTVYTANVTYTDGENTTPMAYTSTENPFTFALPENSKAGFNFLGWADADGNLFNGAYTVTVPEGETEVNLAFTAVWQEIYTYKVEFLTVQGDTEAHPATLEATSTDDSYSFTLPTCPENGNYVFKGYGLDINPDLGIPATVVYNPGDVVTLTKDARELKLYVVWGTPVSTGGGGTGTGVNPYE